MVEGEIKLPETLAVLVETLSVTREDVVAALARIIDPGQGKDLIAADMAKAITVKGGAVSFVIEVDPAKGAAMEAGARTRPSGRRRTALPGVDKVSAVLTAHAETPSSTRNAQGPTARISTSAAASQPAGPADKKIPGVDHDHRHRLGQGRRRQIHRRRQPRRCADRAKASASACLDADVYGPSQPRMLGISGGPPRPTARSSCPAQPRRHR